LIVKLTVELDRDADGRWIAAMPELAGRAATTSENKAASYLRSY